MSEHDPYSRVEYRKLIAWPERIQREWPLIEEVLSTGPSRRVVELGCGPGQHARALAEAGFEVVGVDRSEAMIADATEEPVPAGLRFVLGDITEVDREVEAALSAAGIVPERTLGGFDGAPFDPAESQDLVLVARRQ